jgi:NAD+ synthase
VDVRATGRCRVIPEAEEADYRACMLGLRDYVNKNGFRNVVLGLSGGIDSAICAALAVDALGEERVRTVMLPYALHLAEFIHRRRSLRPGARLPL